MNLEEKNIEQIEMYLNDEMSDTDRDHFQTKLANDPILTQNLKLQQLIREGIIGIEMSEFLSEIKTWEAAVQKRERKPSKSGKTLSHWGVRLAIAASILLLGIIFINWYLQNTLSNEAIIAQNYSGYQEERTRGQNIESINQIFGVDVTDCNEALSVLNLVSPEENHYTYAQTFLGHCYMEEKSYQKAAKAFKNALSSHQPHMALSSVDLYWNYLLANVGLGKSTEEMEKLFQEVPNDATQLFIDNDIGTLRKQLNSFWRTWVN